MHAISHASKLAFARLLRSVLCCLSCSTQASPVWCQPLTVLRAQIHVYPPEHEKAIQAVQATHTKQPKEGVPSRQERRKALYKPRNPAKQQQLAVATVTAPVRP